MVATKVSCSLNSCVTTNYFLYGSFDRCVRLLDLTTIVAWFRKDDVVVVETNAGEPHTLTIDQFLSLRKIMVEEKKLWDS